MIKSSIEIDGKLYDSYDEFGLIYVDADERTAPDEKADAVTSYAGEHGEHRDGRTAYAPFDYKVKFIVQAPNTDLSSINTVIKKFNDAIRTHSNGTLIKKPIAFYNQLNRVKIVGYPDLLAVPTQVYHSGSLGALDCAMVELNIRVSEPQKCNFAIGEMPMILELTTDGENILVHTSRPLASDEALLLLTRGSARSYKEVEGGNGQSDKLRYKSKYRWHVRQSPFYKDGNMAFLEANILSKNGQITQSVLDWVKPKPTIIADGATYGLRFRKASNSHIISYAPDFKQTKVITYGCAVYKETPPKDGKSYRPTRISNVAYFRQRYKITNVGDSKDTMTYETWFTT